MSPRAAVPPHHTTDAASPPSREAGSPCPGAHPRSARPRVLIVGGGFAGLAAARALRDAPVDVTLVDRTNHHLFQPLLYQVATAALAPHDVAIPLRAALRRQPNATVLLGEVTTIDTTAREVALADGTRLRWDRLIVATGARHDYFGRDEWEARAPGLKTLDDALAIRRRLLLAFERAELAAASRAASLDAATIVIVGGGPTGVELAAAISEVARHALAAEFRHTDTRRARIVLVEGGPRLLASFDARLSARARADLEALGVEVRTGTRVTHMTAHAVHAGDEMIPASVVLWAAGNRASPLGRMLGTPLDRAGRVQLASDLAVPGRDDVFVAGDLAAVAGDGVPVPGVASAAMQMGAHAARNALASLEGRPRAPFRYRSRGSIAVIGRRSAVAQLGPLRSTGVSALALWGAVHLHFLSGRRNRLRVIAEWCWSLLTHGRGDRIVVEPPAEASSA